MSIPTRIRLIRRAQLSRPFRVALACLSVLVLLLVLHLIFFDMRPVEGHSMIPTLQEGEWVLVAKQSYLLRAPVYGELVVCQPAGSTSLWIKRVVGLPGDVLEARDGSLYRNGAPVQEPYLDVETPDFSPIKAWDGEYLLLGDDRADSQDSRLPNIGAIPHDEILGHAIFVFWPVNKWRSI